MRNGTLYLLLLLFAILGCKKDNPVAAPASEQSSIAAPVKGTWVSVSRGTLQKIAPGIGSFYPNQTTKLGPQVAGRVQEIFVEVGDVVPQGKELVRLDPTFFELEVSLKETEIKVIQASIGSLNQSIKTSEAEVAVAKTDLAATTIYLNRIKALQERSSSVSQEVYEEAALHHRRAQDKLEAQKSRVEEAKLRLGEAQCRLKQAEEALLYAKKRLEETNIYAPYAAVVTKRLVDTGEPATSVPVIHLLEIQEISTVKLEFSLPQYMLGQVRANMPVEFDAEGCGERKRAKISAVFPFLDESTRSFRCRVVLENRILENGEFEFRPGALAQIYLILEEYPDVLIVPRRSLMETKGGWEVFVLDRGKPQLRSVKTGFMTDKEVEIVEGLNEGEQVLLPE